MICVYDPGYLDNTFYVDQRAHIVHKDNEVEIYYSADSKSTNYNLVVIFINNLIEIFLLFNIG